MLKEPDKSREHDENTVPAGMLLRERREDILSRAYRHGARNVRIFGSVARGESTADSDIDLLVVAGENTSPWFPAGLIEELETLLGGPVDVVTENTSTGCFDAAF